MEAVQVRLLSNDSRGGASGSQAQAAVPAPPCSSAALMIMFGVQKKGGANGSGAPEAPSQEDVKQQAKEARNWIEAWRKKQPVKANA